jgi:hypothetical protein
VSTFAAIKVCLSRQTVTVFGSAPGVSLGFLRKSNRTTLVTIPAARIAVKTK